MMENVKRPQVQVRDVVFGGESYLLCVPLVSRTREQLIADAQSIMASRPDLIEWRVDYYEGYPQPAPILEALAALREIAGPTPIIFTSRHAEEDGLLDITAEDKFQLIDEVSGTGMIDLVDIELQYGATQIAKWRDLLHARNTKLIVSTHNFKTGWKPKQIREMLLSEQQAGADIVKLVTRVKNVRELADLSDAIHEARQTFLHVPVIAGAVGSVSPLMRVMGDCLGSDMTFVSAGGKKSHASQLHIDDLRRLRERLDAPPFPR
ncbi:type I 3-dehydroquinate dehydratase [Paenibacillus daejeonensis]|uniref:type I 3-dehydroquinate dehydratase n=1 Tax=Paenibacillus daejeonensis TaxID=135193 RepID=UPI00036D95E1|nr:type I 3-dehydroquinate dehydratase [Paenibacillus daejeonensis]